MTGLQPGGIRTQWGSPVTRRLAVESREFYTHLRERLQVDLDPGLEECGYLFVASTPETSRSLEVEAQKHRDEGLDVRWLNQEQVLDLQPALAGQEVLGASLGVNDGYLSRPGAPVAAFAQACTEAGVTFRQGLVRKVTPGQDGVSVYLDDGTSLSSGACVIAAGAASAPLAAGCGVELPLRADAKYLFYSDPISTRLIEPLVVFQDHHFAVKHLADGSVLASDLTLGRDGPVDQEAARRAVRRKATELVPLLEHVRYPVTVAGSYDVTPDGQLLLGPIDASCQVWVAAGMNGRGMMLAPSIGRTVADAVQQRSHETIPSECFVGRFTSGAADWCGESRVI